MKKKKKKTKKKRKGLPRCEEGRKKKERKKTGLKNEEWKKEKKEDLKNEERGKKRKEEYVRVGGKGSVWRKLASGFFFFFFFALPIAAFQKVKMQQKVSYSRVFEKRGYRSPKEVYLGSFRIFGCLNYGRVFKKRGYRSPLSDMKLQIFCVCNLEPRFFKNEAIGPPKTKRT